jgi:hypothetical protein
LLITSTIRTAAGRKGAGDGAEDEAGVEGAELGVVVAGVVGPVFAEGVAFAETAGDFASGEAFACAATLALASAAAFSIASLTVASILALSGVLVVATSGFLMPIFSRIVPNRLIETPFDNHAGKF